MSDPQHDEDGVVIEDDPPPIPPPPAGQKPQPTVPTIATFAHLISGLEDGDFNKHASELLQEITEAVGDYIAEGYGRAASGELTIKLKIGCDDADWKVKATVDKKLPKIPRRSTHLYMTRKGGLSFFNERQMALPLTSVSSGSAPAQSVSAKKEA